jgi:hypothetical protein
LVNIGGGSFYTGLQQLLQSSAEFIFTVLGASTNSKKPLTKIIALIVRDFGSFFRL